MDFLKGLVIGGVLGRLMSDMPIFIGLPLFVIYIGLLGLYIALKLVSFVFGMTFTAVAWCLNRA